MSNKINIEDLMDELLDLEQFKVIDHYGRTLEESQKNTLGKHHMIKNIWITPKEAIQFITCKVNIMPTGTIQLSDLDLNK